MEEVKKEGNNLFLEKKYEEAIEKYKEALELCESDTDRSVIHSNLSSTFCKLEKYDDALVHAKSSTRLNLDWYKAWYRLSYVLYKLDKISDAKKAITKTLEYCEKENISEKYILDLKSDIYAGESDTYNIIDENSKTEDSNLDFSNFGPMMGEMMKNQKIQEKLNNNSFKEKMLKNRDNPMQMLNDPDMMEVMGEMMKSFNMPK